MLSTLQRNLEKIKNDVREEDHSIYTAATLLCLIVGGGSLCNF